MSRDITRATFDQIFQPRKSVSILLTRPFFHDVTSIVRIADPLCMTNNLQDQVSYADRYDMNFFNLLNCFWCLHFIETLQDILMKNISYVVMACSLDVLIGNEPSIMMFSNSFFLNLATQLLWSHAGLRFRRKIFTLRRKRVNQRMIQVFSLGIFGSHERWPPHRITHFGFQTSLLTLKL